LRIFKIRWFDRFARKEGIDDRDLCQAVARAEQGAVDADLGGGLIKQRVARKGAGKRGGYRTIFAYRAGGGRCSFTGLPRVRGTISRRTSYWLCAVPLPRHLAGASGKSRS
jgi:hypothetical protein